MSTSLHEMPKETQLKQVLVIDDDADLRLYVQRRLSPFYAVSEATSGLEALEVLQSQKPDIILLDVNLPDMNGLVLLSEFRAMPLLHRVPIVLMTGGSLTQLKGESLPELTSVFPKPFDGKALLSCLAQFLGQHETASS